MTYNDDDLATLGGVIIRSIIEKVKSWSDIPIPFDMRPGMVAHLPDRPESIIMEGMAGSDWEGVRIDIWSELNPPGGSSITVFSSGTIGASFIKHGRFSFSDVGDSCATLRRWLGKGRLAMEVELALEAMP